MEQEEHAKHYLRIRNGSIFTWGEGGEVTKVPIAKFAWALPDLDMIVNWLDEPRVLAYEESQREMTDEEAKIMEAKVDYLYTLSKLRMFHDDRTKPIPPPPNNTVLVEMGLREDTLDGGGEDEELPPIDPDAPADPNEPEGPYNPLKPIPFKDFASKDIRDVMRAKCPPLRSHPAADRAMSLHGFFLAPTSFKPVYSLIPVFTATKPVLGSRGTVHDADAVSCFQDIILPNHLSLRTKTPPGHNPPPWASRKGKMIWRGRSTGGQLTYDAQWRNFQRPRSVEYSNRLTGKGDDRIDLKFTDIIQCDDGRGGRGGYFEKIDFDYRAEGDEEALERLGDELKAEAAGRRLEERRREAEETGAEFDPEVPDGKDEEEWARDKVGLRIRGALEKLKKEKPVKEDEAPPAAPQGEDFVEEGEYEDGGEEPAEEDGAEGGEEFVEDDEAPVIEQQDTGRRRLVRRDGDSQAPVGQPKKAGKPPKAPKPLKAKPGGGITKGKAVKPKPKAAVAEPVKKVDAKAKKQPAVPEPATEEAKAAEDAPVDDGFADKKAPVSAPKAKSGAQAIVGRFKPNAKPPKAVKKPTEPAKGKPAIGLAKKVHPVMLSNATSGLKRHVKPPPKSVAIKRKTIPTVPKKRVNMCSLVKNFYGLGNWMGTGDCFTYKYLYDVDGNTWSQRELLEGLKGLCCFSRF